MIVLDASAAIAITLGTEEGLALRALMLEGEESRSPSLIVPEIANALWKYAEAGKMTVEQAADASLLACSLIDEFTDTKELQVEALREAIRLHHPAYDLFYLILARRNGATLLTLDRKLIKLCEENGVDCAHVVKEE